MPRRSPTFATGLQCAACSAIVVRIGPTQKYCSSCSETRSDERRTKWRKANPPSPDIVRAQIKRHRANCIENGRKASRSVRSSILFDFSQPLVPFLAVRVAIPFSYSVSKNAVYSLAKGGGHLFKRKKAHAYRDGLTRALRVALRGNRFYNNKIWLDILVQKPDHKGDAVNVVDLVCDAAKDALGVDDRWFAIRKLDWEIVKVEPKLIVGVAQEDEFDAQVCSYCGRTLSLDQFTKSRHMKFGVARCCKECGRVPKPLPAERAQSDLVLA